MIFFTNTLSLIYSLYCITIFIFPSLESPIGEMNGFIAFGLHYLWIRQAAPLQLSELIAFGLHYLCSKLEI